MEPTTEPTTEQITEALATLRAALDARVAAALERGDRKEAQRLSQGWQSMDLVEGYVGKGSAG